jgi:cysteine desulfurase / selenocysteine lyase
MPDPSTAAATPESRPGSPAYDVSRLRDIEFPWTRDTIWLDHASIGPLPERTRSAITQYAVKRAEPFRITAADQFGTLTRARALAARMINASAGEIALATSTTFGVSVAARALPLEAGDVVLVSDKEFPANVYPWMLLRDRGVRVELVPLDARGWPDEARMIERLAAPEVRVLAVSLTQFSTGYTVDLARWSEACRRLGRWLVVDAIQAVGQMPVDVQAVPVDLLACGAQKWLLSPWGSGFLYVRQELIARLNPSVTGWMAFQGTDDLTRLTQYSPDLRTDARRFELTTLPYQDMAGMVTSLELLLELGVPAIRDHLEALKAPLLDWADRRGVTVSSPRDRSASAIVCLQPPNIETVHRGLRDRRIYCSVREGHLRFSPHAYNSVDDIGRVVETLDGLV